jgi:tRNA-dihydrouridine synthase
MYTGLADWEEIAKAAELAHKTETTLLGNGDILSIEDARQKIEKYKIDGVLIGRATYGNPWVFTGEQVSPETKLKVALEHCEAFMRLTPDHHFASLRKHLVWYAKAFENATDLRSKLVRAENLEQVREIVTQQLNG